MDHSTSGYIPFLKIKDIKQTSTHKYYVAVMIDNAVEIGENKK